MKKLWVHIRFVIKFIPIQLLGIFINIYGVGLVLLLYFIFGFNNFLLVWLLISVFLLPIAIILDGLGKFSPLWFMMDDGRFKKDKLSEDYKNWLDGRLINFITTWLWHIRNRIWNLLSLFDKHGDEYMVEEIKNTLVLKDKPIVLADQNGFMENDNFAGLKWITKQGKESFQTHSGVKISQKFSIFGIMKLYYRVGTREVLLEGIDETGAFVTELLSTVGTALYYKYSKCVLWFKAWSWIPIIGGKDIWYTFKYHPNNKIGTIHLKFQWEK